METWKDPEVGRVSFEKVLAVALTDDQSLRRVAELEMCRQMPNTACVPSFKLISRSDRGDIETAKKRVREAGFDGAVAMRVIAGRETSTSATPMGRGFWGYYRLGYGAGYVRTDILLRIETQVYSLRDDKLLWSGTSDTMNPKSVRDLIDDVARAVAAELRRDGLI